MGQNVENIQKVLDWTYDKVLQGVPGSDSVYEPC